MTRLIDDPSFLLANTVDSAAESIDVALRQSHGHPYMSPEDVKVALIMTQRALQYQTLFNLDLLERIMDLEEKKKRFHFRK